MGFERLGLSGPIMSAVVDAGYTEPTPIQAGTIPQCLMGRDILGIAQTGTGKTASFTLPMIDILAQGRARARMPRSLILEPTRELAAQVAESFEKYGKNHKLNMALLIGGVNFKDQEKALDRGADVLIATPGRLLDHFERGKLLLTGIEILVVDEADRMLDMGFIPDVEKICERITKNHQTLFFSATMPPAIQRLTKKFLTDPKKIEVARPATTSENIEQFLIVVGPRDKRKTLRHMLREEDIKNAIIFCNRKRDVKEVFASLKSNGFSVGQLHGDMEQSERMETLRQFKANEIQLLCASDVAARGLDVPDVSHVFNYDVPGHAEDYVHRIGRTGRAGRKGKAFTITTTSKIDTRLLDAIEKLTKSPIKRVDYTGAKPEKSDAKSNDKKTGPKKTGPEKADSEKSQTDASVKSTAETVEATEKAERPKRTRRPRRTKQTREDTAAQTPAETSTEKPAETQSETAATPKTEAAPEKAAEKTSDKAAEKTSEASTKEATAEASAKAEGSEKQPSRSRSKDTRGRSDRNDRNDRNDRSGRGQRNSRPPAQHTRKGAPKFAPDDMPKAPFVGLGPHVPAFLSKTPKVGK